MRYWGTVFLLLVCFVGVQAQDLPSFEEDDCPFLIPDGETEGETLLCGWLNVPERHAEPDGAQISLAVAVLFSQSNNPEPDPLIYLEGGPGGAAIASLTYWLDSPVRQTRDFILIDQRGTGYSEPSLNCFEFDTEENFDPIGECRDRLVDEGVDLAAYNSAESAADIAALADALELDTYNLYGISYGTRLALTVLRDYPEGIRSIILDGVYPPEIEGYDEQVVNGWRAFEQLFSDCSNDPICAEAYPDLRDVFIETVDLLNQEPIAFEYEDGTTSDLDGYALVDELFGLMYDTAALPLLPGLIYAAYDGDAEAYATFGLEEESVEEDMLDLDSLSDDEFFDLMANTLDFENVDALFDYIDTLSAEEEEALYDEFYTLFYGESLIDDDSEGMFASVECAEEIPFNQIDLAEELAADVPAEIRAGLLVSIDQQFNDCLIWDVPAAASIEDAAVLSDVPVLLLSGAYDPITPPGWGDVAAASLSQGVHYVFPAIGHGAFQTHPCPTEIAMNFLDAPDLVPEGSCIALMTTPDWVLP